MAISISTKKDASLPKRYLFKFLTNLCGLFFNLFTQAIVPRGLGLQSYGDYSFLSNFFNQLVSFFEMGTSTCFYTKLSQRHKDTGLVKFYFQFAGAIALVFTVLVTLAAFLSTGPILWPGQERGFIFLAAGLGLLLWFAQILSSMLDAYGITVSAEKAKIIQRGILMCIIVLFFIFHQLNLRNFFFIQYGVAGILIMVFLLFLSRFGSLPRQLFSFNMPETKRYLGEFYRYTHPLFVYTLVCVLCNIIDRWVLQLYSGSAEQGFFGLSFQISSLCFIFTSALTPLFTRELSISFAQKNIDRMQQLFKKYVPFFFLIVAFLTCFIAVESRYVIQVMGGDKYRGAFLTLVIMAFYPIYQTYGQLSGSVFFATGETKIYRNIGIIFMLAGLPLTYLFLAPKSYFGLGAGAVGLAIKTMLVQLLGVNVLLYYNCKILKIRSAPYLIQQVKVIGLFVLLSYLSMRAVNSIGYFGSNVFFSLILAGAIYGIMVAIMLYFIPAAGGMRRSEIAAILQKMPGNIWKRERSAER